MATNFHKEPAGDGDSAPTGISPEVEMLIVQKSYLQPGEVASGAAGRGRSRGSRAGRVRRPHWRARAGRALEAGAGGPARRPAVEAGAGGRGGGGAGAPGGRGGRARRPAAAAALQGARGEGGRGTRRRSGLLQTAGARGGHGG